MPAQATLTEVAKIVNGDRMGKSGRTMLDALIAGTTDPAVLARGRLRKKLPALREALEGRFDGDHAMLVGRILAHIDYLDEATDELSAAIEQQLGPLGPAVELLCTIPGVGRRAAEVMIAETDGDMTAFPTAKHVASWAGMCPRNDESAGERRAGKTRKASKWLSQTLVECVQRKRAARPRYGSSSKAAVTPGLLWAFPCSCIARNAQGVPLGRAGRSASNSPSGHGDSDTLGRRPVPGATSAESVLRGASLPAASSLRVRRSATGSLGASRRTACRSPAGCASGSNSKCSTKRPADGDLAASA